MGKEVPCYGCEKRHSGCHSECESYKEYHDKRTAKCELLSKKRAEEAMITDTRIKSMNKLLRLF